MLIGYCLCVACAGAIELAILSEHFRLEFAVVDVQTLRVDRFGEQCPNSHAWPMMAGSELEELGYSPTIDDRSLSLVPIK